MKLFAAGAYDAEGRRKYLSRGEGLEFLRQTVSLPKLEAVFCEFLYFTGCRVSEALAFSYCDVDEVMNVARIRSLKKRENKHIRRVPIPEDLTAHLAEIAAFPADRLWSFSRSTAWRLVKRVMTTGEIFGLHATCKGLRHAFGVRCALANIPLPIIQGWMGHADPMTTAIYLGVRDEEERALIEKTW